MKKYICLPVLFILTVLNSFSQDLTKLYAGIPVRSGRITLKDGNTETFRNLNLNDAIVTYGDSGGNIVEKNISDVYKITRRGSYAGYGAMIGGLSGLLVVLQTESKIQTGILQTDRNRVPVYLGITAGFTVVGGLIGLAFTKVKTIYIDMAPLTFSPAFVSTPGGKQYPMISLKINFN